jgi:hypothetical protein
MDSVLATLLGQWISGAPDQPEDHEFFQKRRLAEVDAVGVSFAFQLLHSAPKLRTAQSQFEYSRLVPKIGGIAFLPSKRRKNSDSAFSKFLFQGPSR